MKRASPTAQRRNARFTVERVHGTMVSPSPVEILNMSLGGAAFRIGSHLRVGDEYTLRLDVQGRPTSVKGVIAWSVLSEVEKGSGGESHPVYSAGIKFDGVLAEGARGLMDFIDAHKIVEEQRLGGVRLHVEGQAHLDLPEGYTVRILSASGMLIETSRPLKVEDVHPMEIALGRGAPLRGAGRVASCLEALDSVPKHYDVGIEFLEMPKPDRSRLLRFVSSLSRGRSQRPKRRG